MKNQFATYEISLKLKGLGFDEECLAIYYKDDTEKKLLFSIPEKYSSNPEVAKYQSRDCIRQINFNKGWAIRAPLYQQIIDWFRKKHSYHISIYRLNNKWCGYVYDILRQCYVTSNAFDGITHDTYEESREQAILNAIEIIENK